jgi:hypothetical protein
MAQPPPMSRVLSLFVRVAPVWPHKTFVLLSTLGCFVKLLTLLIAHITHSTADWRCGVRRYIKVMFTQGSQFSTCSMIHLIV